MNEMKATRALERTVLNRGAVACLLIIVSLTLIALVSACSDSAGPADATPETKSFRPTDTPQTPTSRDETIAKVVSDVQQEEVAEIQIPPDTDEFISSTSTGAGTGAKRLQNSEDESEEVLYQTYVTRRPETGPLGLDERILRADIIARATLSSVSTSTPFQSDGDMGTTTAHYMSTIELRFDAHEYLKGSGENALAVDLPLKFQDYYPSVEEAVAATSEWLPERDTRWDDREAIIFLQNPIGSQAQSLDTSTNRYVFSIFKLGHDNAHDIGTAYAVSEYYIDTYSIRSEKNKTWLPATTAPASGASGASGTVETSYYLEEPPSSSTGASGASGASGQSAGVSSITLSDLKSRIQAMNALVAQGEGVTGYRRCLEEKYRHVRALRTLGSEGVSSEASVSLSSGLPAGSVFEEGRMFGGRQGSEYFGFSFAGPDAHLFEIGVEDTDTDARSYSVVATTTRPLPEGTYDIHYNAQSWLFVPCNYVPNSYMRWNVHVNAPAGTLHEALFDPALDTSTSAVGAGGEDGVLKPASFTFEGVGAVTIERIEWGADSVRMELSPHGRLTGHHVDFIEMDGSVGLSLDFADAVATTTDDGSNALSWSVAESPWADGDTLMLRIYRIVPEFIGAPYAFSLNEDVGLGHAVGDVSATSTLGLALSYSIIGGNTPSRFGIDALTGAITTTEFLDYETTPSYRLAISAAGSDGGTAITTADITVADVSNEPPPTPPDFSVQEVSGGFDMSWRAVPNTLLYSVYWKANRPGEQFAILSTTDAVIELRPEGGALCDQEYEFRLSVHGDGVSYESSWSGWVSVSVTTAVCAG